ncbi:hypothetical protein PINS_up008677 [Pythium insidiosum]|nr:hypothetical protein PINS_up008677 [Pythium insidiosum]
MFVLSYLDILGMEKKNTALIVPNAIEVTPSSGDKAFFTSFVFRDECFQCIQQLQAIKKATVAALDQNIQPQASPIEAKPSSSQAFTDLEPQSIAAPVQPLTLNTEGSPVVRPVVNKDACNKNAHVQSASIPAISPISNQRTEAFKVPERDSKLDDFEIVLDEDLPFSVTFAYSKIWIEDETFFRAYLEDGGETNISITPWDQAPVEYTAVSQTDKFDGSRHVNYNHNKKYIVGPSCIPTFQIQRYKWETGRRLVVSVTSTVSDAPYCDYFRAESRWVFSANKPDPTGRTCKLQVGIRIQWTKSTWLKKQIESTAVGEAKESTRSFVKAAVEESTKRQYDTSTATNPSHKAQHCVSAEKMDDEKEIEPKPGTETQSTRPRISGSSSMLRSSISSQQPSIPPVGDAGRYLSLQFGIQLACIACIFLFVVTVYRISCTLDTMLAISKEAIVQQRAQQELLREVFEKLAKRS